MAALIAFMITSFASAAPISNATSPILAEPAFVSEPRGRGTLRLLFSCVITLVLCVWTAIHPNIIRNPTTFRRLVNKAYYVVLALFSPEIILSIALSEWRAASKVLHAARLAGAVVYAEAEVERIGEAMKDPEPPSSPEKATEDTPRSQRKDERITNARNRVNEALKNTKDAAIAVKEAIPTARKDAADSRNNAAHKRAAAGRGTIPVAAASKATAKIARKRIADTARKDAKAAGFAPGEAFADHSTYDFRRCWRATQEKQWAAFESVRELRLVFREYQTECRPGIRQWFDRGVNALRRSRWTKRLFAQDAKDHDPGRECAYFAVMGGFTFFPLKEDHNPAHESTLTPDALAFLLREGYITTVDLAKLQRMVIDKGKSNMIAKLVVCLQGAWMGVNCLSRKIAGLPLTLLELNVVMHVLCAITVYALWWKKPHDAGLPISLSQSWLRPESWALIYTMDKYGPKLSCSIEKKLPPVEKHSSHDPTSSDPNEIARQSGSTPSIEPVDEKPVNSDIETPETKGNTNTHKETVTLAADAEDIHTDSREQFTLGSPFLTPRQDKRERKRDRDIGVTAVKKFRRDHKSDISADPKEVERGISSAAVEEFRRRYRERELRITAAAAKEIRHLYSKRKLDIPTAPAKDTHQSGELEHATPAAAVKDIPRPEPSHLVSCGEEPYPLSICSVTMTSHSYNLQTGNDLFWVLVPLCLIYGGVHASAWNKHFPTATERLLWRISCVIVGFPGPGAGAIRFFEFVFSKREDIRDRTKDRFIDAGTQIGVTMLWLLALTAAVAAAGGSIYGIFLVVSHRPMTKKRRNIIIALSIETTIVVLGLCALVLVALSGLLASLKWKRVLLVFAVPGITIYCAARAFIVIESFISMRSLPLGAYNTIRWENAWPHL